MPKIEINQLGRAVASRVPAVIAASAWEVCEIRTSLKKMHLEEIVQECENMAKYTHGHKPSVLRDKSFSAMLNFNWATLLNEARNRCPTLLDVVTAICNRRDEENVLRSGAQRVAPIGTILAMLLHQYNRTLSLVQRVNTVLLANGHVEKKVILRNLSFTRDCGVGGTGGAHVPPNIF